MSKRWLILDCNNMCWRSFHTTGNLSHEGSATGVLFGFFRDVRALQENHNTKRVVFAFDVGRSLRSIVYPEYKTKRREKREQQTDAEKMAYIALNNQIKSLRKDYLPFIGYKNIFSAKGYEADDVIASVCRNSLGESDEAIIVSTDQDLYQLLSSRVSIWNPHRNVLLDKSWFRKTYGIKVSQWKEVKALAGCNTDDVKGIKGVGEKTAVKFIKGELAPTTKAFQNIEKQNAEIRLRNLPLVSLPYEGTPVFKLEDDKVDSDRWQELAQKLGMKSLRDPRKLIKINKPKMAGLLDE